jgi:hypothetical protein
MTGINAINPNAANYGQNPKTNGTSGTGFAEVLQSQTKEQFIKELGEKYGVSIGIQSVPKGDKNVEKYVLSSACKQITLAPNIVARMQSNPDYCREIEAKIAESVNRKDDMKAQLKDMNRDYIDSGMIVHDDGSVTYWVMSDDTPEEKARIRKAMAAEAEAKAERRERYLDILTGGQEENLRIAQTSIDLEKALSTL